MTEQATPARAMQLSGGAAALLAVLAMAATVSAAPRSDATPIELRGPLRESEPIRAVAAAVAAVARDLLGTEPASAWLTSLGETESWIAPLSVPNCVARVEPIRPPRRLAARLLDLPPPAC